MKKTIEPLISIIIPTYNRADLLFLAVESCLAQERVGLDIIIVDDGSTDGTRQLVQQTLATAWKDQPIRYIWQENAGAPSARNHGIRLAEGQYVQFLDSDDELLPGKLQKQVDFLENSSNEGCQMCYCFGRMGEAIGGDCLRIGVEAATIKDLLKHLASRTTHAMQTTAPLWRRSFLVRHEGWNLELILGEDLEYYVRLMCSAEQFGFIPEELFFVRMHQSNRISTGTMTRKALFSDIRSLKLVQSHIERGGYWIPEIRVAFWGTMRIIYAHCLSCGAKEDVVGVEEWLKRLGCGDPASRQLFAIFAIRRLFGAKIILFLHQRWMKLRALF